MAKAAKRRLRILEASNRSPTEDYAKYFDDPVGFAVEVLGIVPWSRQAEILRAVAANQKTAVRSGHKVGKSTSCAILALWWFCTRSRARVVMTSSTDDQIRTILWPEIQRLYRAAKKRIGGALHDAHRSGLRASDGRWVFGISTNKTENMGGQSGAELLFIIDEASGVDESIFNAIEGNRAGGARLVMFGNPTQMSGTFYESFHEKVEFWCPIHVSSEETPNVTGDGEPIEGLATKEYCEEKRRELGGPGNAEWDIRVGGNFPEQAENSIIGVGVIAQANKDWREPVEQDGPLEIGVDVARYGGDDTVIWPRRGKYFYEPTVIKSMDGPEVASVVIEIADKLRWKKHIRLGQDSITGHDVEEVELEKPLVKIDAIGVGASPYDILKRNESVKTVGVNVGEAADKDEDYFNLRSQLWFALRDFLKEGGKFKSLPKAHAELVAPVYKADERGRRQVEKKDEIRKRLHRSPDLADSMALAVYKPPVRSAREGSSYI